jgi:hypothetical protein
MNTRLKFAIDKIGHKSIFEVDLPGNTANKGMRKTLAMDEGWLNEYS